jgi:site-specific DNA-cytosine methylase/2-polyprenyl-3-methyl-5-hydroxy-6-metoxy-1,4-benzoquinol methylase
LPRVKVLAINTYGGSLLLGAAYGDHELIGSYEDSGFGSEIQRENFPEIPIIEHAKDWPTQDLSGAVVIAHPPCSAFSNQNFANSSVHRGIDAEAFACTRKVLDYAMSCRARAIAVESVVGAFLGAAEVHDFYAEAHGYDLYRVLQSGTSFGPQRRDRFWAIFVRREDGPIERRMTFELAHKRETVGERLATVAENPGGEVHGLAKQLERFRARLKERTDLDDEQIARLLAHDGRGAVSKILADMFFPDLKRDGVFKTIVSGFATAQLQFLDPGLTCNTIMHNSWLFCGGRALRQNEYKALMGFPDWYVFPGKTENYLRMYLSKGVIPQVAQWILDQIAAHLAEKTLEPTVPPHHIISVEPGEVADFREGTIKAQDKQAAKTARHSGRRKKEDDVDDAETNLPEGGDETNLPGDERQPTRGRVVAARRYDKTALRANQHGDYVHRDYLAHSFRWGWACRWIKPGMQVLDAGCGQDMSLVKVLTGKKSSLPEMMVSVDLNRISKPVHRGWLEVKDEFDFVARYAELGENRFDLVTSFEVIEHMGTEDGASYLYAIREVLKPGGTLLLSTPVFNGVAAANHIHEYEIPELRALIEAIGFKVVKRFGTFMSYNDMKRVATPEERKTIEGIREFYDDEVTACFLAPLYPDSSRNNAWVCEKV